VTTLATSDQARLLRVEEVARLLNIGRAAVYDLIRSRRLRSIKIGASRRVPREAIDEVIALLIEEATQ
jgi:excisionase family DNA binding protein